MSYQSINLTMGGLVPRSVTIEIERPLTGADHAIVSTELIKFLTGYFADDMGAIRIADASASWEERYWQLEAHHIEEMRRARRDVSRLEQGQGDPPRGVLLLLGLPESASAQDALDALMGVVAEAALWRQMKERGLTPVEPIPPGTTLAELLALPDDGDES